MNPEMVQSIIVAALSGVAASSIGQIAGYFVQRRQLRFDLARERERTRTEFMAEQVVRQLLESQNLVRRNFEKIKAYLGGFEDNELRKLLVRAGAVRFREVVDGEKMEPWGLISRNAAHID